jgi:hypothetical protein
MSIRTAALTAFLTLSSLGLAASAQAQAFGVETDAETLGYVGCYSSTQYLPSSTYLSSVANPATSYLYGVTASAAPQITVQTTVGSTLSVDGKLRAQAKAFYWDYTVGFGGDVQADATARIVIHDIPAGVTLQSASGVVYPVVP